MKQYKAPDFEVALYEVEDVIASWDSSTPVGPGDPELMTLKAISLIRENDVIALPGKEPKETTAYKIAVAVLVTFFSSRRRRTSP